MFVTSDFKQGEECKIVGYLRGLVEISTDLEENYKTWEVEVSPEEVYGSRLEECYLQRTNAYAELNQNELRFDDEVNGTTVWVDTIKAIKEKFPKPVAPVIEEL